MKVVLSLLLLITTVPELSGQELCTDTGHIFNRTEFMPEPSPDLVSVQEAINENFSPDNCGLKSGDLILIRFKINCKGEDFDYEVMKIKTLEKVDCGLAEFLQTRLSWTTARMGDNSLDFGGTLVVKIQDSKFTGLSTTVIE